MTVLLEVLDGLIVARYDQGGRLQALRRTMSTSTPPAAW
jgi:hypothetical protein